VQSNRQPRDATGRTVPPAVGPTIAEAAEAFLARPQLDPDTARSYGQTLTRLRRDLGAQTPLGKVTSEQVLAVFVASWSSAAARTWNRHRAALRSFATWAAARGWVTADLAALLERRKETQDRTRAIDRHRIEALWVRRDLGVREKALWRLLYESAARADEILGLNVEDLDLDGKRARVTRKGGNLDWVQWESGTSRLLPRLLKGRRVGPVFLAERRPAPARTPAAVDVCPDTGRARLSYERAEYLFKQATGYTLHQLRHSRLTHLGEDGWSVPMLMALSGHENPRTLGIYVKPSAEAVARALAKQDHNRRRR